MHTYIFVLLQLFFEVFSMYVLYVVAIYYMLNSFAPLLGSQEWLILGSQLSFYAHSIGKCSVITSWRKGMVDTLAEWRGVVVARHMVASNLAYWFPYILTIDITR